MKYLKESSLMATKDCRTPSTTVLIEATSCLYSSTRAWLGLFWDIWLLFVDNWLGWLWNIWIAEISFCVQVFIRWQRKKILRCSSVDFFWTIAQWLVPEYHNSMFIVEIFILFTKYSSRGICSLAFFGENWGREWGDRLGSCLSDWFFCHLTWGHKFNGRDTKSYQCLFSFFLGTKS